MRSIKAGGSGPDFVFFSLGPLHPRSRWGLFLGAPGPVIPTAHVNTRGVIVIRPLPGS